MGVGWAWAALLASSCDARLSSVAKLQAQTVQKNANREREQGAERKPPRG